MKIKDIIIKETENFGNVQSTMGTGNQAKVLITKPDGTKVEVPATASTPTDKGMELDPAAISSELKAGTPVTIAQQPSTGSTATTTASMENVSDEEEDLVSNPDNHPVGNDPTDMFIQDVTDRAWEKSARDVNLSHLRKLSGL